MTEIIEKAKELGALLQSSQQVQKYNAAKEAYNCDEEIQRLVKEFNMHKMSLMSLSQAEEQDEARMAEIEGRIKDVYAEIMKNEKLIQMQGTARSVEELLAQVNGVISFYVIGEEPTDCTHDCSTCGGCH